MESTQPWSDDTKTFLSKHSCGGFVCMSILIDDEAKKEMPGLIKQAEKYGLDWSVVTVTEARKTPPCKCVPLKPKKQQQQLGLFQESR